MLCAFAENAEREGLVRVQWGEDRCLEIKDGFHPVIRQLSQGRFVPNDLHLNKSGSCAIITGANMGGKSTFLRQAAIIVIMAQMGSFVPAASVTLGLVDKVFARLGASDDFSEGDSTFMVEMREAAHIVSNATEHSLVLIAEIGRGTATTDGLAIAQSILHWMLQEQQCRLLFATHFHALTRLEESFSCVRNLSVASMEEEGRVVFTHRIRSGPASKSYGIEVARLAGLPEEVLDSAEEYLEALLEQEKSQVSSQQERQLSIFSDQQRTIVREPGDYKSLKELRDRVHALDVNSTTPIEALQILEKLQKGIQKDASDGVKKKDAGNASS